jgi:hypothetical protein
MQPARPEADVPYMDDMDELDYKDLVELVDWLNAQLAERGLQPHWEATPPRSIEDCPTGNYL